MNQLGIFLLFLSGTLATQVPVSGPSTAGPSSVALTAGVNRSWTAPPPLGHVDGRRRLVSRGADADRRRGDHAGAAVVRAPVRRHLLPDRRDIKLCPGYLIADRRTRWSRNRWEAGLPGGQRAWEGCRFPYESKQLGLHVLAGPAIALPIACRTGSNGRGAAGRLQAEPRPGSTSSSTEEPECTLE